MNKLEIFKSTNRVRKLLKERRLKEAFALLNELNCKVENWQVGEELRRMEETYRYMIHYMMEGMDDPHRESLYADLTERLAIMTNEVERTLQAKFASSSLYLNLYRTHSQRQLSLRETINHYHVLNEKAELSAEVGIDDNGITADKERALIDVFDSIWLNLHLSDKDAALMEEVLTSQRYSYELKCQAISALMMSLLQCYDSGKLMLLLGVYDTVADRNIAMRALVVAIICLYTYRDKVADNATLINRLTALTDRADFQSDVKSIIFDLIRTRDTDRINKKMKEEVIPEIMKLQPEIMKRFKGTEKDAEVDINNMEENPEWAELLDKSGLNSKLKELSEMQLEGGDVFMIAFSNLKNFSFFNKVSNWFLPFSTAHSELSNLRALNNDNLMGIICGDSIMCDSDKYSFGLSVAQMPEAQRSMMIQQFDAQFEQINQHRENSLQLSLTADHKTEATKFIRDIYRFFKLFNRRSEFNDPLRQPINFVYMPVIADMLGTDDNLRLIGEFYFTRGYYSDASALFKMIESKGLSDELILQKIGYCYQSLKEYDQALDYYKKAEILNPDNSWLVKKIALCHKNLGQWQQAAVYYEKALERNDSNLNLVMNLGHCLLQSGEIERAVKCYYKVEYLDEKSTRAVRPIAWCEFELGQYDNSERYYKRVLEDNPTAQDYMNAGHLMLATGRRKEALSHYSQSLRLSSKEEFIKSLLEDSKHLAKGGIEERDIPILIDKLLYDTDNL